jgi:dTDP-L-rhamnose 4-epimerase
MKKVLITGGAGFIGTNVARDLIQRGYQVTIFDCFLEQIHGNKNRLPDDLEGKVKLIIGSVEDKEAFYAALRGQQVVIHYAAETGTGQSMYNIAHYSNVNIQATAVLCDFIMNEDNQIENVIVASSRSIYGEGKYSSEEYGDVYPNARTSSSMAETFDVLCPFSGEANLKLMATDEESKIHPSSYYGITKQVQEQMIILTTRLKGINGFALRYQNVYGPGQSLKNPYTGVLSVFSRLALKNEKILIFEDGKESRDFVYIEDVVNATVGCIDKKITGQHILNVGSGVSTTILEVANAIVKFLKSDSKVEVSGAFREGDIRHNYADMALTKKALGFRPKWTFEEGINEFLKWVLEQNDIPETNDDFTRSISELEERGLFKS